MTTAPVAPPATVLVATGCDTTVPRIRAEFVLRAVAAMGHPPALVQSMAQAAGLQASEPGDPFARVELCQVDALYEEGARRTGDEAFGLHAAEHTHPRMLDLAGYALLNGPCLVQGFRRLRPYLSMLHGPEELTLSMAGALACFTYRTTERNPPSRQRCEAYMGIVFRMARVALGHDENAVLVSFSHAAPADASAHRRVFGCPVHFGRPLNEIVFDAALLERPLASADPGLYDLLGRYIHDLSTHAAAPNRETAAGRVRRMIPSLLSTNEHAIARIAKRLCMSPRTLQRRLRQEGTSYHTLVEDARRELALRHLRHSELSISRIADLLGYTTVAAFYDAFHRWTTLTPRDYRRAMQTSVAHGPA
jgi:AraC-like DNA-binding protein